ncbi:DNA repair protein RecO [Shewanella algae]|uniref:DNA repair protein RecO n=1 Tax=Shewanella algae TaxID=38313 RepID=UPI003AAD37D3
MLRGYVLHARPYRESSMLLNLLVDGLGRVDAVARVGSGKRSIKSIVQPFQPLLFQLSGRSDLRTLTQIESASPAVPLSGDALYAAMYLNELLVRVLGNHQSGEALFFSYHQSLLALAKGFEQTTLRYFELRLLSELGCMPSLVKDADGADIQADGCYRFIPEQGFIPFIGDAKRQEALPGSTLLALAENRLQQEDWQAAKVLTRQLLRPLLGDKPLLSRQLFARRGGNLPRAPKPPSRGEK